MTGGTGEQAAVDESPDADLRQSPVTAVNGRADLYERGQTKTVNEDAGAQSVAGWATAESCAGPADESGQLSLNLHLYSNDQPTRCFRRKPSVAGGWHADVIRRRRTRFARGDGGVADSRQRRHRERRQRYERPCRTFHA
jgi:hypothetical protein